MPQKVYFDESGYTGNNLLHPEQEHFAYASVATSDEEARDFVENLIRRYGVQNGELKGKNLIKYSRGRKAIDEIFSRFGDRLKFSVSNKKFALACKFHEYIFEPCYSSINSLFYRTGFHRFVANILYMEFVARGAGAEQIFREFEDLMRSKREGELEGIFSSSVHPENSPVLTQIREFAQYRADDIREELVTLSGISLGKWILDLTNTALFTLLANWGTEHEQLTAVCDHSDPLKEDQSLFKAMIDRKIQVFSDVFGKRHPITFNLAGPVQFCDSKVTHGIQIADAVAAAAVHVISGADDEHARKWREVVGRCGHYGSILPDMDAIDLGRIDVQRNALVLTELHERAKKGISLIEGMPEYMVLITRMLQDQPVFGPKAASEA